MKKIYSFIFILLALSFSAQAQSNMTITLAFGLVTLPNGGSFNLGTYPYGTSTAVDFAIRNSGDQNLVLTAVSGEYIVLTGTAAPEVTKNEATLTPTIAPSGNSTFSVTNSATTAPGTYSLTLTVQNNDPNDNPYVGTVTYTISAPTSVVSAESVGISISPNPSTDGRINIIGDVLIDKVVVYGLNGTSEEFAGTTSFHTRQKGLLVVHVHTNKGIVAEKIRVQ